MMEEHEDMSYFDKIFAAPDFIWEDGICNLDAVERSTEHLDDRLSRILTRAEPTRLEPPDQTPSGAPSPRAPVTPSRSAVIPLQSNVWNGVELLNYHAQIKVGQLPKSFFVALDTGSSLLWLQSRLTPDDLAVQDQNTYIPAESSRAKDLGKSTNVFYADGSSVSAAMYADEISAGLLVAESQTFGAASTLNIKDEFRKQSSNGIMGLGLPVKKEPDLESIDLSNLVLNLHHSNRVKYASLSIVGPRNNPKDAERIDKEHIMQPRGYFVIGSVDPKFYTGNISWMPRQDLSSWIVELSEVTVNGKTVLTKQRALIDTGTPFIVANTATYNLMMTSIEGARTASPGHFSYPESSLASVGFKFGDRLIQLYQRDLSLGRKKFPRNAEGGPDTSQPARYVSSIIRRDHWPEGFEDNLWVLGGIFIDNAVVIFDFDGKRIGFADISEDDPQYDPTALQPA